ncbi:MAG: glutamine-hydrolyzing carbamoyl-phosphate synthase small subunit [Chloroflexi bacterium]|nr:glutamine-hydrolyzing carbamoyl-phosphate synthase small subunit [Chloroflexota bacterium]
MTPDERDAAYLILEDGSVFAGERLGAEGMAVGEVVFNTSMTGYQEMLTDPSYGGQILVPTYPMIGNYGINPRDWESGRIQVRGLVVRQDCDRPSNPDSVMTVDEYLRAHDIPGIAGVDTRAITRRLRTQGVMMGVVTSDPDVATALAAIEAAPRYGEEDVVAAVTAPEPFGWDGAESHGVPEQASPRGAATESTVSLADGQRRLKIVVDDFGVKYNILRELEARGCDVTVVPAGSTADEIFSHEPDGVLLSPGPGDPELLDRSVETARELAGKTAIMGICLGHQVIARAFGAKTFKLKFGHRGGNHSVRDIETGRVYVTAQNHGYAVSADDLPDELEVTHIDLSDGTVEGLRHRTLPIMTIQYHSEASPGPLDNEYLFDRFVAMVREGNAVGAE